MLRRLANLTLLAAAGALLYSNLPELHTDPRRALLVGGLAAFSVFLNFAGLLLPTAPLHPLLRVTGCAVFIIVAGGFAILAYALSRESIAPEARADPAAEAALATAVERFVWLAAAAGHVGISLLMLPPTRRAGGPKNAAAARELPG